MADLDNETKLLKVFDELYVGFKEEVSSTGKSILGFATPVEKTKAFEKRKNTVDRWARGYYSEKKETIPARVIKNDAVDGFRIADGGRNAVWRVWDPRGFEMEISSANLSHIIDSIGLQPGGVIPNKCVWGRLGAQNILVPEGSDLWNKTIKDAEKLESLSKTLGKGALVPGNIITIKGGQRKVYLGRFNVVCQTKDYEYAAGIAGRHNQRHSNIRYKVVVLENMHVLADFENGKLTNGHVYKRVKAVSVDGTFDVNPVEWINDPNTRIDFASSNASYSGLYMMGVVGLDVTDVRLVYRDVTNPELDVEHFGHYGIRPKVKYRYNCPLWIYFTPNGERKLLNNTSVLLRDYALPRHEAVFKDENDILSLSSSAILDMNDLNVNVAAQPERSYHYSGYGYNTQPELVMTTLNRARSKFISQVIEVGVVIGSAFIPVMQ